MYAELLHLLGQHLAGDPFGRLLIGLAAVAFVIVVGRFALAIAWKLVTIAAAVVGVLFVLSTLGAV